MENRIKMTLVGRAKAESYIRELSAKRKEILDAGKDTADETYLPTIEDIISDIEFFEENGEYVNGWGVTDSYDSDYPLYLVRNVDYID